MKKPLTICIALLSLAIHGCASTAVHPQKEQSTYFDTFINKFDSNGDNVITKIEFDNAAKLRFEKMDIDNNGVVSKEEFKTNTKNTHKGHEKKYRTKMDADNNSLLTKKERKAKKQCNKSNHKKSSHKGSKHYFPKIDKNNDGVISFEENKASSARLFDRLDSNNDQTITQDEIQSIKYKHKK